MEWKLSSRRDFLKISGAGAALTLLAVATPTAAAAAPGAAQAGQIRDVPRNRTLIMAGLGGEHPGGFTDVDNYNIWVPGFSRSGYSNVAAQPLFYYNMMRDEFIYWNGESYQYNSDFTEVSVKIRNGVAWSDGTPFTSNDIAFTINTHMVTPELTLAGDLKKRVQSVTVIDEQNFKVTLNATDPQFVFDIFTFRADVGLHIMPAHVWQGQDPKTFKFYDPDKGWPIGTGPYKLVGATIQQKIWDLDPNWWAARTGFQPLPKVERMIFLPGMNEITMAQMLVTNEIDQAFSLTPGNMRLVQSQNPKITTSNDKPPYGYMDWWPIGLGLNHEVEPFGDKDIRWALSYAINRDQIVKFGFSGFTSTSALPFPPYPGMLPFFDSVQDLLQKYDTQKYDLDKVDQIMTGKGYAKDNDGMWQKAGQRITFDIITFPQHPSCTPTVPIVTEQLRQAGFDATFSLPADFAARPRTGQAAAFIWGHGGSMRDPWKTMDFLYHINKYKPTGTDNLGFGLYRWRNQAFSDLVDQMGLLQSDDPKMKDLFHQAMEIWLSELPDPQLVQTVIAVPMNTTYWSNWPSAQNYYIHEGFWHRTAALQVQGLQPAVA
jgi:peptide/nickel transport system substrate-binding protein